MTNNRQLILLMVLMAAGCAPSEGPSTRTTSESGAMQRFEYTRLCMGVRTHLALYCGAKAHADEAAAAAFDRLAQLDSTLSDYRADSELTRLNDRAGKGPMAVSDDLFNVLKASLAVSRASDGAFDVTVGPAVSLWRESRLSGWLADFSSIERAKTLIDWHNVVLNEAHHTVDLREPGMKLDLGGIGKGYAAQQAADLLKSRGVSICLVALAGDIVMGDPPPGKDGWSIAVAERTQAESNYDAPRLLLANAAVSTSGDVEQFVEIAGTRYSHVIDPRTALGVTSQRSVTVVAPQGEIADALSSALCVLGPDRAPAVLRSFPPAAAVFAEVHGERIVGLTLDPHGQLHWAR